MKRTFAKRSFQALAAMFFLVSGLFLTANNAGAQTLNGQSNLNWVGSADAQTLLGTQVQSLSTLVGTQIPGSQLYNDINVRIVYYKNVYRFISEGDAVSVAVPRTTLYMGAHGVQGDANATGLNVSKSLLATIEAEATDLLSN
ncbi:hypothetical protein [Runella sp.]|uniref:hypothetical protein n=1 Tax=Runella sp. TaxID=1960881 RepID=UPI00301A916C